MTVEDVANFITASIFIVLVAGIVLSLAVVGCLIVYDYFWIEDSIVAAAPDPVIQEEIAEMKQRSQQERTDTACMLCYGALGAFFLGWLTGHAKFHTLGLCLIVGALAWDYKVVATAIFAWYFIVPALAAGAIMGFFRKP